MMYPLYWVQIIGIRWWRSTFAVLWCFHRGPMDVPCFEQVWLKPVICIRYYMNMSIDDMSVKKDHIFWGTMLMVHLSGSKTLLCFNLCSRTIVIRCVISKKGSLFFKEREILYLNCRSMWPPQTMHEDMIGDTCSRRCICLSTVKSDLLEYSTETWIHSMIRQNNFDWPHLLSYLVKRNFPQKIKIADGSICFNF